MTVFSNRNVKKFLYGSNVMEHTVYATSAQRTTGHTAFDPRDECRPMGVIIFLL